MNSMMIQEIMKMSSRDIAELTFKQHAHVLRDIEKCLSHLALSAGSISRSGDTPEWAGV